MSSLKTPDAFHGHKCSIIVVLTYAAINNDTWRLKGAAQLLFVFFVSLYGTVVSFVFVPTHTHKCLAAAVASGVMVRTRIGHHHVCKLPRRGKGQKGRRKRIEESPTRARKAKAIERTGP